MVEANILALGASKGHDALSLPIPGSSHLDAGESCRKRAGWYNAGTGFVNTEYLDVAPVEDAILTLARWHDMVSAWDPRRVEAMRVPCQSEWVGIIRQIKARLRV